MAEQHGDGHGHDRGDHGGASQKEHGFTSELANEWGSQRNILANGVVLAGNPPVVQTLGTPSKLAVGQPQRLINLHGDLKGTQLVSVAAYCTPPGPDPTTGVVFFPGPIVGILDFSGGGGGGTIEFDIPCNGSGGLSTGGQILGVSPGGGAIVAVPAGSIQFSARNDANLMPSDGSAGASPLGQARSVALVGAFAGYGSKTGRLTRTVYAANFVPGGQGVPGGAPSIFVYVPPFARSFRVLRFQTVPADILQITQFGPTSGLETFALPGTIQSPEFILGPTASIQLDFPGGNTGVFARIALVFDIENGGH